MKKTFVLTFFLSGLLAGFLIVVQLKTDVSTMSNFPVDEIEARESLINLFLNEQSYLQSRIVALRRNIEEAQDDIKAQSKDYNLDLLKELKKKLGLSEQTGKGLEIYLDDSPYAKRKDLAFSDNELVQASDLRDIVNALFAANAEAISVNKQRVIATTAINSVGSNILVNNSHVAPPFYILATGNKETLIRGLNNSKLLGDLYARVSASKVIYRVKVNDYISIPVYNGNLDASYLNLIET